MLSVFRRPSVLVFTGVILAAASTPRIASAASCAVIDFSAVEQRTESVVDGKTVSTLVATPAAAPGDFVVLEADFGCAVSDGFDPVAANNAVTIEVLRSDGVAFADSSLPTSFESFPVPGGNVQVLDCAGPACNGLRFQMPASGLAGPARITVRRAGTVVARIFGLAVRTASCDKDADDTLLGTFTLLPPYNELAASQIGTPNSGLQAAIAGNGSLLLPLEHPLFGVPAVDATATRATGPEIDKIPNGRFVRALSDLFRPLPAIHRLVPFGELEQGAVLDRRRAALDHAGASERSARLERRVPGQLPRVPARSGRARRVPEPHHREVRGRIARRRAALVGGDGRDRHQRRAPRRPERRHRCLGPAALRDVSAHGHHHRHRAGHRAGGGLARTPRGGGGRRHRGLPRVRGAVGPHRPERRRRDGRPGDARAPRLRPAESGRPGGHERRPPARHRRQPARHLGWLRLLPNARARDGAACDGARERHQRGRRRRHLRPARHRRRRRARGVRQPRGQPGRGRERHAPPGARHGSVLGSAHARERRHRRRGQRRFVRRCAQRRRRVRSRSPRSRRTSAAQRAPSRWCGSGA